MSATYTPREGSVAWKAVRFLQANRDEQLDADLISAKWDCARANVHTLLSQAVQAGLLVRSEDLASGELVYSAGTRAAPKAADDVRSVAAPSSAPAKRPPSAPFRLDISTVQIDKGVPMPSSRASMDWTPLLARLEVGDSFLLPDAARSSIGTAMKAFKDATGKALASRKVDGGIRVWRTA